MANIAQGGACLAVYFKTRDAKIKAIAVPSAFSAMLGITEAALFGINLRFVKPFLAALAGGARRRLGGGQPRRHERGRADGDPRHGDRAGQFAGQLYHRPGNRFWQRLRALPAAEIQHGRTMMEELSLIKQALRAVMNGQPLALRDPHRPTWHLAPSVGLLNDPNGFIQHNGVYHLFYQWNPLGCDHRNKCWGHWQSIDLVHWEHQPLALAPGACYDSHGCYPARRWWRKTKSR